LSWAVVSITTELNPGSVENSEATYTGRAREKIQAEVGPSAFLLAISL
jgi:hypothetical protein